ncbi:MAG: hypothetical protein HY321_06520 [Armatimonadetes bacterium]|nr:hypothetical protein [Armatimonadota bacterium]
MERLRIGYATYGSDFSRPADRRRFCYYAAKRGLQIERADPSRSYDLVVVTEKSDLSVWARYPRSRGKLVADFANAYLAAPSEGLRGRLRGPAKFVTRQWRHLHLSHHELLVDLCRRADGIVCTTQEVREAALPLCPNVHIILDFHVELGGVRKVVYGVRDTAHLAWEGEGCNVRMLEAIGPALAAVAKRRALALHVVTDLMYPMGLINVGLRPTKQLLDRVLPGVTTFLYQWNVAMAPHILTACDMAIIPIEVGNPLWLGKCENKLILFWRLGIPVLTSETPAYGRAMAGAGVEMTCRAPEEWQDKLQRYICDEAARRDAAEWGRRYAEAQHGEAQLMARWERVLESVLG